MTIPSLAIREDGETGGGRVRTAERGELESVYHAFA